MKNVLRVTRLVRASRRPSTWKGAFESGSTFRVHYQRGRLRVDVNDQMVFERQLTEVDHSIMGADEMMKLVSFFDWSAV